MRFSPRQEIEEAIADGRLKLHTTVRIDNNSASPFPPNFSQIILIPRDNGETEVYSTSEAIVEDTRMLNPLGRVSAWEGIEKVAKAAVEKTASDILLIAAAYDAIGRMMGSVEVYAI